MPKNPKYTELDSAQTSKRAFHEEHDALRVVNVLEQEHEILISSHKDSIQSMASSKSVKPSDNAVDCSQMRKMCGYGSAGIKISPDGEMWVSQTLMDGVVVELCAAQIQVLSGVVMIRS